MATHDVIGVGLGPFNLGLAALLSPVDEIDAVFCEARDEFSWHPGMMLDGATVQTPFLADLVTLADPTHPLSYLAYLKAVGRLYPFYIREDFHPLRAEFDDYCRWAAAQLRSLRFGHRVEAITHDGAAYVVRTDRGELRARKLVLGTGTPPWVPECAAGLEHLHNAHYLDNRAGLLEHDTVTVVGSGQSAAEIYRDLLQRAGHRAVHWVTRSPRFFPLEYTKLTLEMTSPEYVDHFHALPPATRDRLVGEQRNLYKGISAATIDGIFDLLYERSVGGPVRTRLLTNTALTGVDRRPDGFTLHLHHAEQDRATTLDTGGLVLATGYRHAVPAFLDGIRDRLRFDDRGRFDVRRDYSVDHAGTEVYVQNAELHTHGFVAPDLGMAAYRNSSIIAALLGREHYPIEKRIAFQEFGGERVTFHLRPVDPGADAALLHGWLSHPKAAYWLMGDLTVAEVAAYSATLAADPLQDAFVGLRGDEPVFLMERYDPRGLLAGVYDVTPGDVGMHFLVAPTDTPVPGFTRAVITAVMEFLFADPNVQRVVVEPDARNTAVHALNRYVGFVEDRVVELPEKKALLSFCTRKDFRGRP